MRAGEKESRRERDASGALGGPDEEKRGDLGDFGNPQVTVQTIDCENSKLRGLFSIPVAQRASGKNPGSSAGSGPTHTRSRPPGNLATWFLMMRLVKLLKSVFLGGLHSGEKVGQGVNSEKSYSRIYRLRVGPRFGEGTSLCGLLSRISIGCGRLSLN